MKNVNVLKIVFLSVVSLIFANGCSTVKVPMIVTHPAEVNMSKYKQIAIGEIDGNMGRAFGSGLRSRLTEEKHFEVVDRRYAKQIMAELSLSQSDLSDSKSNVKLGKLMSASALISGYAEGEYNEELTSSESTCGNKKDGYYACTYYYRTGTYSTSGTIDVIDVETGEILGSKELSAAYESTKSARDKRPAAINKRSLKSSALSKNINVFLKVITPWLERVYAPFIKDGDIPELERGINQAKLGDLDKAIKTFANAAKSAEDNPEIDAETIAEAYFDLGLAYNFSWKFNDAIIAFKKAYELDADDDYLTWINKTNALKREREKLEAQGMSAINN